MLRRFGAAYGAIQRINIQVGAKVFGKMRFAGSPWITEVEKC
jgi:hypothetical protein